MTFVPRGTEEVVEFRFIFLVSGSIQIYQRMHLVFSLETGSNCLTSCPVSRLGTRTNVMRFTALQNKSETCEGGNSPKKWLGERMMWTSFVITIMLPMSHVCDLVTSICPSSIT